MRFIKRTTNPSDDNKCYLKPDKGYNKCIRGNTKHGLNHGLYDVLPNCTGYCFGRYLSKVKNGHLANYLQLMLKLG
jgi:hypothetical protein